MLKLCGTSICKPLEIMFEIMFGDGYVPNRDVVPVFKKGNKQILKNYCLISLLPVCGKLLEKLILNKMFKFFIKSDLILSY